MVTNFRTENGYTYYFIYQDNKSNFTEENFIIS